MFENKNIVLTGAGGGIGRALARLWMEKNARVWAVDRDPKALVELEKDAAGVSGEVIPVCADVTSPQAMERLAERVEADGGIDFWVNNAGIVSIGGFLDGSEADFARVVEVNLNAVLRGTRLALTRMESRGSGSIVNVASVAGHVPAPYMTSYCATKSAVIGFTHSLREELRIGDSPVKLFLVSPGFVDTGLIEKGKHFPEWLSWALAKPESVAREIVSEIERGKLDIFPTLNGRMMLRAHRWLPGTTVRSSRALLTRDWKDLLLNRYRAR